MQKEVEQTLSDNFPGARFIEEVESIVLQFGDKAVHVYPLEFTIDAITGLAHAQNTLAEHIELKGVLVEIGGKHIRVRVNKIESVASLPDGRAYTVSPYVSAPNLERIHSSAYPTWLSKEILFILPKLVDKAIISTIHLRNMPNEYQLCEKNIHVDENQITIVDIAALVARFL